MLAGEQERAIERVGEDGSGGVGLGHARPLSHARGSAWAARRRRHVVTSCCSTTTTEHAVSRPRLTAGRGAGGCAGAAAGGGTPGGRGAGAAAGAVAGRRRASP